MSPQKQSDLTEAYLRQFGEVDLPDGVRRDMTKFSEGAYPKESRAAKAYEVALDHRKFEIDLLWKRAGYFWLLLAALVTALGLIVTGNGPTIGSHKEQIALLLSCAGAVTALSWGLVNLSSKLWQQNWEHQVELLENIVVGPLYKTVFYKPDSGWPTFSSVSGVSIWMSWYFAFLFLACVFYFSGVGRYSCVDVVKVLILGSNTIFAVLMFHANRRVVPLQGRKVALSFTQRNVAVTHQFKV